MLTLNLCQHMIIPRGRADRKGLVVAAVVLLLLQAPSVAILMQWIALPAPLMLATRAMELLSLWMAIVCAVKRLHDLGMSGWNALAAFLVLFGWTFALAGVAVIGLGMDPSIGGDAYLVTLIGSALPALAMLLWLHFAKGMASENRFGPVTGANGFSWPVDNSEAQTRTTAAV